MFPIWLLQYCNLKLTSSKHEVTCGTAINACAVAALWAAFIALLLFLLIQSQSGVFSSCYGLEHFSDVLLLVHGAWFRDAQFVIPCHLQQCT